MGTFFLSLFGVSIQKLNKRFHFINLDGELLLCLGAFIKEQEILLLYKGIFYRVFVCSILQHTNIVLLVNANLVLKHAAMSSTGNDPISKCYFI